MPDPRTVRVEYVDASGPRVASAVVADAPPLPAAEREARRRSLAARAGVPADALDGPRSVLVRGRRYDVWRAVEVLEGSGAPPVIQVVPLVTFTLRVQADDVAYERVLAGPPFPLADLECQPPREAARRLAVFDCFGFDARQAALEPYRQRAAATPAAAARLHELALMVWYQHVLDAPGSLAEAEPPLLRALELHPGAVRYGLLGEVHLQLGRGREALRAFTEAARLEPAHPRYHYCASVAHRLVGEAAAAARALARARRVAGPRLKRRFTAGSNPLEDFRYALLCEAGRLQARYEGAVPLSKRELAERDRAQNRIRRSRVPKHLRVLVPLAEKWGIGDGGSRGYFVRRATRRDKQDLRRVRARYAQAIQAWLDTRLPEKATPETGAFLYLLEACEEML